MFCAKNNLHIWIYSPCLPQPTKLWVGNVFTSVCLSTGGSGWVCLVPGSLQGVSMPCPRSFLGRVGIPGRWYTRWARYTRGLGIPEGWVPPRHGTWDSHPQYWNLVAATTTRTVGKWAVRIPSRWNTFLFVVVFHLTFWCVCTAWHRDQNYHTIKVPLVTGYYFYQVFCHIGCLFTLIVSHRAVLTVSRTFHAEPRVWYNVSALDVRHPDVY